MKVIKSKEHQRRAFKAWDTIRKNKLQGQYDQETSAGRKAAIKRKMNLLGCERVQYKAHNVRPGSGNITVEIKVRHS